MKCTLDFSDFCEAFRRFDRQENFSREGLELLFDYCEELDSNMELDVIALCCGYTEDTLENVIANYSINVEDMDDDDTVEAVRDYLSDNTVLVGETLNGFVYAAF